MNATLEETKSNVLAAGDFCWYELMTPDAEGAKKFYSAVFGWNMDSASLPDSDYTIVSAGSRPIGGVLSHGADVPGGAPGQWVGYIAVENVDAASERVMMAGGTLHKRGEIPGVGEFCVVSDPQGALLYLFKGNTAAPPRIAPGTAGAVGWQQLDATDWMAAWAFYEEMFGWHQSTPFEMGAMGTYQTFSTNDDEPMTGGMMTHMPSMPGPVRTSAKWNFYFNVDNIRDAFAKAEAAGAKMFHGPVQVPGDRWIADGIDPQGATFGLLSNNG